MVAVNVRRVLLFVWDVNVLKECEGDGNDIYIILFVEYHNICDYLSNYQWCKQT